MKLQPLTMVAVAMIDTQTMVAESLKAQIEACAEFDVVGVFRTEREFLAAHRQGIAADICVIDPSSLEMPGVELISCVKSGSPLVKVLILASASRPEVAARLLVGGADGFVTKLQPIDSLIEALRCLSEGRRFIDPSVFTDVIELMVSSKGGVSEARSIQSLSQRERAVLEMLARGDSTSAIAEILHLSPKTVSTYRSRILEKLHLKSTGELIAFAIKEKIADPLN